MWTSRIISPANDVVNHRFSHYDATDHQYSQVVDSYFNQLRQRIVPVAPRSRNIGTSMVFIHSFILFAFINYSTKLQLIIIHLAGSPGSYFAYLKDCLKKKSKKLECKLSVAEQKY